MAKAAGFAAAGEPLKARGWLAQAAKSGHIPAIRELAVNLLSHQPIVERDGFGLLQNAAQAGDAAAAYYWGLASAEARQPHRWQVGIACLKDAADRGMAVAAEELALLAPEGAARFDPAPFASRLPLETIANEPRVACIRDMLRPDLCDWLITHSRNRLERAPVYDPLTGDRRIELARSNSHMVCTLGNANFVMALLRARMLASIAPAAMPEATTILHYSPGEEFLPHYDYFDTGARGGQRETARAGQRRITCLVYLNEDYEGGETDFLRAGIRHRGRKGDGLVFWNVRPDGTPDPLTYHAGRAPTSGEKWVVSQWLR